MLGVVLLVGGLTSGQSLPSAASSARFTVTDVASDNTLVAEVGASGTALRVSPATFPTFEWTAREPAQQVASPSPTVPLLKGRAPTPMLAPAPHVVELSGPVVPARDPSRLLELRIWRPG